MSIKTVVTNKEKITLQSYQKTMELGKIIGLKGTMEILCLLDEAPCQHKIIDSKKIIPSATLTRRLKELQSVDLIKKNYITSNRRETHQYDLTTSGIELMKFVNKYEKIMKLPPEQQKIITTDKKY